MPVDPPGFRSITVKLTVDQYAFLERLGVAYEGMKPGTIARILIAYAIPRSPEAMAHPAAAVVKELTPSPEGAAGQESPPS